MIIKIQFKSDGFSDRPKQLGLSRPQEIFLQVAARELFDPRWDLVAMGCEIQTMFDHFWPWKSACNTVIVGTGDDRRLIS